MLKKNSIYTIETSDLTDEGLGIGRAEGIAVFIPGMLPGEKGRVRIVRTEKRYAYGKLEELTSPSKDRIEAKCPVFNRCGGCSLLNMSYEAQLLYKQNKVKSCLERIGKCDAEVLPVIASPKKLRCRNKMAFPIGYDRGKVLIGCYRQGSHDIADTSKCFLQSEKTEKCIEILRRWIEKHKVPVYDEHTGKGWLRHFVVRENHKGELMCAIVTTQKINKYTDELVKSLAEVGAVSIIQNINRKPGNLILGEQNHVLYGASYLKENLLGLEYDISLHSFLQVNHDAAELLYKKAIEFADVKKDEVIADLYCGAGTISLYAAGFAKQVYGIEIVPQATSNAKQNAKANGITNAEFICADCDGGFDIIKKRAGKLDCVIVDPPRKGLAPGVINSLSDCGAKRIVYVSCDPATLARDIGIFVEKGFVVEKVQPVDMFPQTTHVETVVLMSKLNK